MIELNGNFDKLIIVLHEIYGINEHIEAVCNEYFAKGFNIICPSFIEGKKSFKYSEEKEAYINFMNNIGFEKMGDEIEKIVENYREKYSSIFLMGFSVGATAAWFCSVKLKVEGAVCFYGSRIRDYLEIKPKCKTLLFYPEKEESFEVKELIEKISEYKNVESFIVEGEHGFADKFSIKYNKNSAEKCGEKILEFIKNGQP